MKRKKEDYLVIGFGVILVIIISLIAIMTSNFSRTTEKGSPEQIPTTVKPSITKILPTANTRPPLLYDDKAQDKLLELIKNRRIQSNADTLAKNKVLTLLPQGKQSGILRETRAVRIDYTKSADLFQVEILTTDIKAAKDEANIWFREQGLSQEAICTLPISFYMNYEVANQIRNTDILFNPLGNGC